MSFTTVSAHDLNALTMFWMSWIQRQCTSVTELLGWCRWCRWCRWRWCRECTLSRCRINRIAPLRNLFLLWVYPLSNVLIQVFRFIFLKVIIFSSNFKHQITHFLEQGQWARWFLTLSHDAELLFFPKVRCTQLKKIQQFRILMTSFERPLQTKMQQRILVVTPVGQCFCKGENGVVTWKKAFLAVPGDHSELQH